MTRDVLLVGSVPIRPASRVFEVVAEQLGGMVPRIPDGDQHGWILAANAAFESNPALEVARKVAISTGGVEVPLYALRDGVEPGDLELGPYGYADVAHDSYREFVRLREEGVIPTGTRFQVTMPGPGTSAFMIQLPPEDLLPVARAALKAEIDRLVASIPADDLTVQLDIAMEAEHEEYRRRPEAFHTPIHETFDWTVEQMAESASWLANRVPAQAELGFHICSVWHHFQGAGQDNTVLVDTVNAIAERVSRPIGYVHLPTIPEHTAKDFEPLRNLRLDADTHVYLGVIHQSDGLEGAQRRIAAAQTVLTDFGIASFCGLGNPATAAGGDELGEFSVGEALQRGSTRETVTEVLALHREAALAEA